MKYSIESLENLRPPIGGSCPPHIAMGREWDRAMFNLRMSLGSGDNIEIGCLYGNSTVPMAAAMVNVSDTSKHYSIDPFIGRSYQGSYVSSFSKTDFDCYLPTFESTITRYSLDLFSRIVIVMGYSQDVLPKVAEAIPYNSVAMLFIDGDHSESGVYQDIVNYNKFVKVGGVIAFDDWDGFGVTQGYSKAKGLLTGTWEVPKTFTHSRVFIKRVS